MGSPKKELEEKLNKIVSRSLIDLIFGQQFLDPETRKKVVDEFNFNEGQIEAIMTAEGECLQELCSSILGEFETISSRKNAERG